MKSTVFDGSDTHKIADEIINGHLRGELISIHTSCTVEYDGRASTKLPYGDRIVMIKPDGTTLVHGHTDQKPINWQPSGSDVNVDIVDGQLQINTYRSSPSEELNVQCHDIEQVIISEVEFTEDLDMVGTEKQMHIAIMRNPSLIGEDFEPIKNEYTIENRGDIDIFGKTGTVPTIIEVKRRTAQLKHVDQLKRYVTSYVDRNDCDNVRGILVSPDISSNASERLVELGYDHIKLDPKKITEN